jgi:hypothetical protein
MMGLSDMGELLRRNKSLLTDKFFVRSSYLKSDEGLLTYDIVAVRSTA